MNLRVDSHMHTPLCGHAVGDPLDYAKAAHANGIDVITITCHIPMKWEAFGQAGTRMQLVELEHYMNMVSTAAIEAKGFGVEVLCGIEAEVYPDASHMEKMDIVLSNDSFDFVLGMPFVWRLVIFRGNPPLVLFYSKNFLQKAWFFIQTMRAVKVLSSKIIRELQLIFYGCHSSAKLIL